MKYIYVWLLNIRKFNHPNSIKYQNNSMSTPNNEFPIESAHDSKSRLRSYMELENSIGDNRSRKRKNSLFKSFGSQEVTTPGFYRSFQYNDQFNLNATQDRRLIDESDSGESSESISKKMYILNNFRNQDRHNCV